MQIFPSGSLWNSLPSDFQYETGLSFTQRLRTWKSRFVASQGHISFEELQQYVKIAL